MTAPRATTATSAKSSTRDDNPNRRNPPRWDEIRENIPAPGTPEGAYFHYTPAEAAEWLPFGAHKLRRLAHSRGIPYVDNGNRVWFSGMNIRAISEQFTVEPFEKPAAA
ncbi:helix-turn-helix domain-containing protein [Streptomyces sp. LRE541]|uniref:helix-turn-helix domain-containing protein n=1 Tax=Streptomyces sp. LRE541 TaxID=2931983 RepID=UPI002010753F|nr:helix-turn-helix domain-containing protein [Streptomyces sp. LRE541]UPZ27733.1 helix-turn-helix domain-containing protein [Streptomyces sp. LRE541]